MKVLLFVQSGEGRPKCVKQFGGRMAWARQYFSKIRFGEPGQPSQGWLVECENAGAGRRLIEATIKRGSPVEFVKPTGVRGGEVMGRVVGRILASGRREA